MGTGGPREGGRPGSPHVDIKQPRFAWEVEGWDLTRTPAGGHPRPYPRPCAGPLTGGIPALVSSPLPVWFWAPVRLSPSPSDYERCNPGGERCVRGGKDKRVGENRKRTLLAYLDLVLSPFPLFLFLSFLSLRCCSGSSASSHRNAGGEKGRSLGGGSEDSLTIFPPWRELRLPVVTMI
ncbi:hypothetical protein BHE74_00004339 [Ensete ventricosum]|nr:hypothetical protein BHE74_00004339 [Ensete ventricosum]